MSVGALTSNLQTMPIAVKSGTTALATTAGKNLPMVQNSGALAVIDDAAQVVKKTGTKGKIIAAILAGVAGIALAAKCITENKEAEQAQPVEQKLYA